MSTFQTDNNNGFAVENHQLVLLPSGLEAVRTSVQSEIRVLRGEDRYSTGRGLPNFETIWEGTPDIVQFEVTLRVTVLGVEGVTGFSEFSAVTEGDVLSYRARVSTVFGDFFIQGSTGS